MAGLENTTILQVFLFPHRLVSADTLDRGVVESGTVLGE